MARSVSSLAFAKNKLDKYEGFWCDGAMMEYPVKRGGCRPLGVSHRVGGINFALKSERAEGVTLCIYLPGTEEPFTEIELKPHLHRTEGTWHVEVANLPQRFEYAYRVRGPLEPKKGLVFTQKHTVCDPYAKSLSTSHLWGVNHQAYAEQAVRGRVALLPPFDWQGDRAPGVAWQDLIIYEMHVRGFTQDISSHVKHRGSFLGVIEKIPHLKMLGVNAVELLPVFEFNENEYAKMNPLSQERLYNFWGYSTVNFFSPMNRYATKSEWHAALIEFKMMVRALHKARIEVILDVVYNHTAEGNEKGPVLSFRGIDNPSYYMLDKQGRPKNYSGCGNTFNCNHPQTVTFILDSLRYWVTEMHVDGFRFDLASILTRDQDGSPLENPPLIEAINADPVLSKVKLIAEAWDCGGLYQVGSFPGKGKWSEWNGSYRDVVRRFIKGTDGQAAAFAQVLSGSENLYGHTQHPYRSVNFVTAHDGFTLRDLVSYQEKHNLANGEGNRDGANTNESWNCGYEGKTTNRKTLKLREQQMRNLHLALMLSLGIPMLCMGDEYQHSRQGNNNGWCQDNALNWFQWNQISRHKPFFRFYQLCIQLRKSHPLLRRAAFLSEDDIDWHGKMPYAPNWDGANRLVAYTLKDPNLHRSLYVAFNANFKLASLTLPEPPHGTKWYRLIDTSLTSPHDFEEQPKELGALFHTYTIPPYTAFVAESL